MLMRYNNLFAFKKNSRNYCKTTGRKGYCIYESIEQSIQDYHDFERERIAAHGLITENRYQAFIARTYTGKPPEDPEYKTKLKRAYQLTKDITDNVDNQ